MKRYIGWKILGFIALGALFVFLFGTATMLLWNWLVPELFAGPVINFWQALGLLFLSKLLFGFPKGHHHQGGGWGWKKGRWQEKMRQKMEHLSPEEKERLRSHFDRCMGGPFGRRWGQSREERPEDLREDESPKP